MGTEVETGRWNAFFYDLNRPWPDASRLLAQHFPELAARLPALLGAQFLPVEEWVRAHDGRTGQPFLLGPDLRPDLRVNAFFASRAGQRLDPDTWRKYGYALRLWLNFLFSTGGSWDTATPEDIEAFKYWRMTDDRNPSRVTAGTVRGDLAALSSFYRWAAGEYRVANPILRREVTVPARTGGGLDRVEALAAQPSGIRERDVKWLDPAGYRRWRDVGLCGFGLDGREDPRWRGRNGQRDAAFAEGLYQTGLRLQEWASVLDVELPPDDPGRGFSTCRLADACAKGKVGRRYWMPRIALTKVLSYMEGPRALAVLRAQRKGRYERPEVQIVERVYANRRLELRSADGSSRTVSLDALDLRERQHLFRQVDGLLEPLAIWLNEDGWPRDPHGWHHTFADANGRIERLGLAGFGCTPHMLRHSFALRWYAAARLVYENRLGHLDPEELRDFRIQFGNVWLLVQTLLGHRDVSTTMDIYLEPFRGLEVELLLEQVTGIPADALLAELFRSHPLVLGDPLSR